MNVVSLSIDVEPDCPPYLANTFRGVAEGLPRVLEALDDAEICVTAFCTGEVADRFPDRIHELVSRGHELGSHGHTHARFDRLNADDARHEIAASTRTLRSITADVTSFRAPNLSFPDRFLPLLEAHGYRVDASPAKYKAGYHTSKAQTTLTRVAASTTSSVLRLPRWIRDPWLLALASPVVLFVHPWEFVDLTRERLRVDCRFRTGYPALRSLREVIALFKNRGDLFVRVRDLAEPAKLAMTDV